MRSGVRFTSLYNGENLLAYSSTWQYNGLIGAQACNKKLEDMFYYADKLGFTDIIDTIPIRKDNNNDISVKNSGINGDLWTFPQRMDVYKKAKGAYKFNIILELEYPTYITEYNYLQYAKFTAELINEYSWVKYWQIMKNPEQLDSENNYKCDPVVYVQFIKNIYETIKIKHKDIKIGGGGIYTAIAEYVNSTNTDNLEGIEQHDGWLAIATGEKYATDIAYEASEPCGFLPYVDFISYQGNRSSNEVFKSKDKNKDILEVYENYITKMKKGLQQQANRNNFNLNVEFISIEQGHEAIPSGERKSLQLQAYYDLREFLQDFTLDVLPCKKQLLDEFGDNTITGSYYGILNENTVKKPSYIQYEFLLNILKSCTKILTDELMISAKRPFDYDKNLKSLVFTDDKLSKIVTVIYPVHERDVDIVTNNITVSLLPAINRKLYLPNGFEQELISNTNVQFQNNDFIVVEEQILMSDTVEVASQEAKKRLEFYQTNVAEMIRMIPKDYNTEIIDTNFYKLMRSVAIEYGDAEYERNILEDNMYLETAHGDAIYNNFGLMIGVKWKHKWSEEKYRQIVSGIIESLLSGANKNAMAKAITAYTDYEVRIYELFKDYEHYGLEQSSIIANQYKFVIEVQKKIEDDVDLTALFKDIREVVDIVKPAHTLPIIMVVYIATEDYGDWYYQKYGVKFQDSARINFNICHLQEDNKYGYKTFGWNNVFNTANPSNIDYSHNLNSCMPLAPKYTLFDREYYDFDINKKEIYDFKSLNLDLSLTYNNKEKYVFPIYEKEKFDINLNLSECKYGIEPSNVSSTLITNEKTINNFKTGFHYKLKDEVSIIYKNFYKENYIFKNINCLMSWEQIYKEYYKPKKDNVSITLKQPFKDENHYAISFEENHVINKNKTNSMRYAIKKRNTEETIKTINISLQEKINKPTASASITIKKGGRIIDVRVI